MSSRRVAYAFVVVLVALNAYLDLIYVRATYGAAKARTPPPSHYTFRDDDYPPRLPLPSARRAVKLTIEDSARYALRAPEAALEWLSTATVGDGNVHLGRDARLFVVGVTHQLHCMRAYREALAQGQDRAGTGAPPAHWHGGHQAAHLAHCLNFLRMSTLCAADVALEPPDALRRDHERERAGGVRACADWVAFYDEMEANAEGWSAHLRESDV